MRAENLRRRMDALPAGLLRHIDRVVAEAMPLAEAHGLDPDLVALAAQGHDIARATPPANLLRLAVHLGIDIGEIERDTPLLLHGPVGAALLARDHGIDNAAVLEAARCHTTARAGLGAIERVVFLADKFEPNKRRRDPALQRARELAFHDLDAGMLAVLDLLTERAIEQGWALHPWMVAARNELVLRGRETSSRT